jgi:hypothetical protein
MRKRNESSEPTSKPRTAKAGAKQPSTRAATRRMAAGAVRQPVAAPAGRRPRTTRSRAGDAPARALQLKVTLRGIAPPIWRRLLCDAGTTLDRLHSLLQVAMGWRDCHLHAFTARGMTYASHSSSLGPHFADDIDESGVTVAQVLRRPGGRMRYEYDFGDGWEHDIVLEKVLEPDASRRLPTVLDGRRACPPDDVGGIFGYAEYLAALTDRKHPLHREMVAWGGRGFDPDVFDLAGTRAALEGVRRPRAGKTA